MSVQVRSALVPADRGRVLERAHMEKIVVERGAAGEWVVSGPGFKASDEDPVCIAGMAIRLAKEFGLGEPDFGDLPESVIQEGRETQELLGD